MRMIKKIFQSLLATGMIFSLITPANVTANEKASVYADSNELKIASYNIAAKGNKTAEIGNFIKNEGIDIVGFQEVDKNTSRNANDMLKEIADTAGYQYAFRKNIDYGGGEYGIGIATKETIIDSIGDDLNTDGYEGRGWQRIRIQVNGKAVSIYNTHLTWEDQALRASQMRVLYNEMEADSSPYKIITGDFNAQESNDEFDLFLRNYHIANGWKENWLDTYIPSDATMMTNAIDNIITTRNMKITNVEAKEVSAVGSDHRALIATYELLDDEAVSTQLLNKRINQAEKLLEATTRYTADSLQALSTTIDQVKLASKATQDEVNSSIDTLDSAIKNLERIPVDPSDPIAYWDFEGDNPLVDKTGRGNDGSAQGTITYAKSVGNLGQAVSTQNGYVSIKKTSDDLKWGTSDYSIGFWIKAGSQPAWASAMGDKNWSSGGNPGIAIVHGNGKFYTTYAANGHSQQENIVDGTSSKVFDNKWHYIVAVLDRDDQSKLYLDGKLIAATSIASTANADATVSNPFNIGADGAGNYGMNALIDEVKIYRSVLSEEEIENEYLTNCDKSELSKTELIKKTEDYLKDLVIDTAKTKKLESFESDDGLYISKIFCSENDIIIDDEGNILRTPIVDKQVQITYIIQEKGEGVAYDDGELVKNKWITIKGDKLSGTNAKPQVVPTLQEWCGKNSGAYAISAGTRIVVGDADKGVLQQAAEILQSDIKELFAIDAAIVSGVPKQGDIVLALDQKLITSTDSETQELVRQSYRMEVDSYVTISGSDYKGVFYGTRSILQAIIMSDDNTVAYGTAIDYPNYPIRKFMLDLGRKYFPMWYLNDVVKYASWLKLTDFQAHISEDTFNDYSAFRLESDINHLTSTDGYYTKDEYRDFQSHASSYGIRVITEIDAPAHSRRFIELGSYPDAPEDYKNLGLDGTHLNLSETNGARERVFKLMDSIFDEYLGGTNPVIITDAFNVGMDEYFADKNDLRAYAVHVINKLVNDYGKTVFAWDSDATLPNDKYPKDQYPMDNTIIDFWKWEEVSTGLKSLMDQGYKVVNGDHRWYIVPGAQIGFYDYANEERLFNEVSAGSMMGWYGNGMIFPEGHSNIVGGTMLLWNDRGMFAGYTVNDIFARQRSQYPYLAQNYWYGKEEGLSFSEFKQRLNQIEVGPGLNNLYKSIQSKDELVYDLDMEAISGTTISDKSGNGYDAEFINATISDDLDGKALTFNGNGYITTQHKALKWPYSAVFDIRIDESQAGDITLFEEIMPEQECVKKDGNPTGQEKRTIVLKEQANHTYCLQYSREGFDFEHDYTFEKGKPYRIVFTSEESKITGGEYTKWNQPNKLYVNGKLVSTLQGPKKPADFKGTWWVDSPSMNMPLEKIGQNLVGSLDNFKLYNRSLSDEEVKALGGYDEAEVKVNIALNKPAYSSSQKSDSFKASNANDGNISTRWGSDYNSNTNDPFDKEEWLMIDLEDTYILDQIVLHWQSAYAKQYRIQISNDGKDFTDVKVVSDGKGDEEIIDFEGVNGRYLRIYCNEAVPSEDSWKWNYGYSLFEVEAYGKKVQDYTVTFHVDDTETKLSVSNTIGILGDQFPEAPKKEGYVFKEWNTKADGSGDTFKADSLITKDMDVYAIFEKASDNLALNKPAYSSSQKSDNFEASNANDGDTSTRWGSNYNSSTNDPFDKEEWLTIDLLAQYSLDRIVLHWQDAYAKQYRIQVSDDGKDFTDVKVITDGKGNKETIDLEGVSGRYVRIYCSEAVPSNDGWEWNYGYSLFEVEIYEKQNTVDKSALISLIEEAMNRKDDKLYTSVSLKSLMDTIKDAQNVIENELAKQSDIDEMVLNLQEAIEGLTYRDADYREVDEAIKAAKALNKKDYKDFSEVEKAINNVKRGLDIRKQKDVDAMTKAIKDAILNLVKADKPNPPQEEFIYSLVDKSNNVTVVGKFPVDTKLVVEALAQKQLLQVLSTIKDQSVLNTYSFDKVFDIYMLRNNEVYQPEGLFTIRIKLDEKLIDKNPRIVYISDNGEATFIESTVKNGYITFTTKHNSYYAIISDNVVQQPNSNLKPNKPISSNDGIKKNPITNTATSMPSSVVINALFILITGLLVLIVVKKMRKALYN